MFQNHVTVTIQFYNNSFVTYQNSTFSGIWFNQNLFLDCFFHNSKMCKLNKLEKINNYLTLEVNMLNMHIVQ